MGDLIFRLVKGVVAGNLAYARCHLNLLRNEPKPLATARVCVGPWRRCRLTMRLLNALPVAKRGFYHSSTCCQIATTEWNCVFFAVFRKSAVQDLPPQHARNGQSHPSAATLEQQWCPQYLQAGSYVTLLRFEICKLQTLLFTAP